MTEKLNQDPSKGGIKNDIGKVPLDLLPMGALIEVGKVLEFGAKKYASYNWAKGMSFMRLIAAALRHIFAWSMGEDKDPETGLSHIAHALCCLLFLMEFIVRGKAYATHDDRHKWPADDTQ